MINDPERMNPGVLNGNHDWGNAVQILNFYVDNIVKTSPFASLLMIRLLMLDIDGTLTRSRDVDELEPEALRAIQSIKDKIRIGIATGNAMIVAKSLARYIGIGAFAPIIAENGCLLSLNGEEIPLCRPGIKELGVELARRLGLKLSYQFNCRSFDAAFEITGNEDEIIGKIRAELQRMRVEAVVESSGYAIHVLPPGIDKSTAIMEVCRRLSIPCGDVAYIGDGRTDIGAVKLVGWGVAVSNAVPELRAAARIITKAPSGLGVAEFIREYISR